MSAQLGRSVSRQSAWRALQRMGAQFLKPRLRHIQSDPVAQAAFKARLRPLLHKVWRLDGQRPLAPVQHRYDWRYLVGFVHPASGRTVFHLASSVNIPLFEAELAAFARQAGAGPKKKLVLVLDRAGWHTSLHLRVPDHGYLHFLPPYSPELQPAEHRWPLTNAPLINRHFSSMEELEEVQAQQCVALQAQPALVRSTTLFHWWPQRLHKRHAPGRM